MVKDIIGIVGGTKGRFPDAFSARLRLFKFLDENLPKNKQLTIVSGASDKGGVDLWVRDYAVHEGYVPDRFIEFPPIPGLPSPDRYYRRNQQIADRAKETWAFLGPNESLVRSGAMQTIRMALRQGKPIKVFRITRTGIVRVKYP